MRLIDVDKLKEVLFPEDASGGFWGYGTLEEILDQQPTVDAEPVRHGKWKGWHGDKLAGVTVDGRDVYHHYHYYECSECHRKTAVKSNYCPNCGATMDGD